MFKHKIFVSVCLLVDEKQCTDERRIDIEEEER